MAVEGKFATFDITLPPADAEPSEPSEDPHLGQVLGGQYRVVERLGSGGMGTVYRGVQLSVQRPVAIKLIASAIEKCADHVQRFRREAEALAKLRHPNTVHLLDFGVSEQRQLFMVMEMLSGHDLEQELTKRGPLDVLEALGILRQVVQSISEAHALCIVHRDLKPSNIFLSQVEGGESFVKVMDFGVAGFNDESRSALTVKGAVLGTAAYMSPEQAQGFEVDGRADLYSLGVILFEMLTGRTPFQASSAISLLIAHVSEAPPRLAEVCPDLPELERVQSLLDALLSKAPAARPSSATEVIGLLDELVAELGSVITGPRSVVVVPAPRRRRRGRSLRAALALAALAGSAAFVTWQWQGPDPLTTLRATAFWPALEDQVKLATSAVGSAARTALDALHAPSISSVTIATYPPGAIVRLAGVELGKTPYQIQVKEKTLVQLDLPGHRLRNITVDPDGDPNLIVKLIPLGPLRSLDGS